MSDDFSELIIGVLGLGHVGLPTAVGLADLGWTVIGADDDSLKAKQIARGECPFYEPQMQRLLREHLDSKRFSVAHDVASVVRKCHVLFVCVGTPQDPSGSADLSQVESVARTVAGNLNGYKLVVEKSTSPVRTAEQIKRAIQRYTADNRPTAAHPMKDTLPEPLFDVAVNPEFLREGTAISDFFAPDRIVIGFETNRARELLTRVYEPLLERLAQELGVNRNEVRDRLLTTDLNTAEIIKHSSNAFLSTKISFINMVADLCDAAGADVKVVQRGLQMDHRIGHYFLQAGVGFGGYCLPKDLRALINIGESHSVDMTLLKGVEAINEARVERLINKLKRALWVLPGKTVAVWGLAFKPETDDIREAPSLRVIAELLRERTKLRLYDPQATTQVQAYYPPTQHDVVYCDSCEEATLGADALIILTEWAEFQQVDFAKVRESMSYPLIIDGRNFLDTEAIRDLGFEYHGMGQGIPSDRLNRGL